MERGERRELDLLAEGQIPRNPEQRSQEQENRQRLLFDCSVSRVLSLDFHHAVGIPGASKSSNSN